MPKALTPTAPLLPTTCPIACDKYSYPKHSPQRFPLWCPKPSPQRFPLWCSKPSPQRFPLCCPKPPLQWLFLWFPKPLPQRFPLWCHFHCFWAMATRVWKLFTHNLRARIYVLFIRNKSSPYHCHITRGDQLFELDYHWNCTPETCHLVLIERRHILANSKPTLMREDMFSQSNIIRHELLNLFW